MSDFRFLSSAVKIAERFSVIHIRVVSFLLGFDSSKIDQLFCVSRTSNTICHCR